jgi:hypothetical protein
MTNKREKQLAIIRITVYSTRVTCKKNNRLCLMTGNIAMGLTRARIGGLRRKLNSMVK